MARLFLRSFFAVTLLCVIALGVSWEHVPSLLTSSTIAAIGVMQVGLLAGTYFCSYRHKILVSTSDIPTMSCWNGLMLSAGLNLVIPGRVAELVKATYLRNKHGIPLANGTAAILVERLYDVLIVVSIGLLGAYGVDFLNVWILAAVLSAVSLLIIFLVPIGRWAIPSLEGKSFRIFKFIAANFRHIEATINPRISTVVFLCSAVAWLLHYAGIWLFFQFLPGHELTPWQAAIVFVSIIFAGAVPALPAGVGLVQAAVVTVLMGFGKSFDEALLLSLLLHISEILLAVVTMPIIMMTQSSGIMPLIRDIFSKQADGRAL